MDVVSRCGYVAILGRPNVGKSTLLNYLIGQKISITSRKPQTTRQRILGIKTMGPLQFLYVDTPGLHQGAKRALNRYMNRAAFSVMNDVDVAVFVVDALQWTSDDQWILQKLESITKPIIVAINKVDRVADRSRLLPFLEMLHEKLPGAILLPISALKNDNLTTLEDRVGTFLPEGPHLYPDDQLTDMSQRFVMAEIIREKLMKNLGQELPYALTVQIEDLSEKNKILHVSAIIWVEKMSQKSIVIGKEGKVLKKVGVSARVDMEKRFSMKVFLRLWVKVKESWSDDERTLRSLGYDDLD